MHLVKIIIGILILTAICLAIYKKKSYNGGSIMAKNVGTWFENAANILKKIAIITFTGNKGKIELGEISAYDGDIDIGTPMDVVNLGADHLTTIQVNAQSTTFSGTTVIFDSLPTSDPSQAGRVWSNSGVLTVSAG